MYIQCNKQSYKGDATRMRKNHKFCPSFKTKQTIKNIEKETKQMDIKKSYLTSKYKHRIVDLKSVLTL